jgi:hypothetical protein
MSSRGLLVALPVIASVVFYNPAAFARRPPGEHLGRGTRPPVSRTPRAPAAKTPIDEFERMSPEQQQRALERLPPGQRQKLQERIERFNQLPPAQQRTLRNLYNRLHQLPVNQQESVRKAIDRFSKQTPDRQQAVRDELRAMAAISERDRKARMASAEFRNRFGRREQGIVKDMLPLLGGR